ncbi:putative cinnamyl alcohol dehydrogenase 4 [Coffea eugenioides]|uniref:putative cinnamyl alcohol dehydrogenase 4 n=1 Tax=Coffea eugenioides TaxID=49369 RepID=UPI000F607CEE|nr:putative cinnamyl alcohol dehydrogenase 4 [Coffea eugenioides]
MRHNMNQPGKSLGVIGLGGLGHLAVKFGKAFGLKVTVWSTSFWVHFVSSKAIKMLILYHHHLISLHFIIDTASGDISFDPYLSLLKTNGVLILVGFPSEVKFMPHSLITDMRTVSGSATGETKQTQEKCWTSVQRTIS